MESFMRAFQIPMPFRMRQRPQATLYGEHGLGTMQSRAGIEGSLRKICALPVPDGTGRVCKIPSEHFVHIQTFLQMLDVQDGRAYPDLWSLRPRLYTLLHGINALTYMDAFVKNSIYDISLPFDASTLPVFLADAALRASFLASQVSVITDARHLESSSEEHIYFNGSAEDHIVPYRTLGHGGYGYVDVVISRLSAKPYARKRVARGRDSDDNRRVQQYLVDEIRLMKNLRHRHLTKIVQPYSDYKYIGFLMEPIADCNLYQFLARRPLCESRSMALRHFYGCLAGGVEYLHYKHIRHRDLKLENILVKNTQVYIADFGTAMGWTGSNRGTTQTHGVPATPHYMAPEVDSKQSRNVASDMWSLGIVFLEMLTVLKGGSLSKWKDHLQKKADRVRTNPWPCRNPGAVHEWMSILAATKRNEWTDDESMTLRDNDPLTWIKSLLEHNQDTRLSSRALVTTIADSMYFRSFACPDCAEDFMDPHYRYGDRDELQEDSRDVIEAGVATLVGAATQVSDRMDDRNIEMVAKWLGQTRDWIDGVADEEPRPFPMPGAYNNWLEDQSPKGQFPAPKTDCDPSSHTDELGRAKFLKPPQKQVLHDAGFFVDHEEDSTDAASTAEEPDGPFHSGQLFPIVHDASSNSSEDASWADSSWANSPVLEQIVEEDEGTDFAQAPAILHRSDQHSIAQGREQRLVRFKDEKTIRYQYVEEDDSCPTRELSHPKRALSITEPLLELNTSDEENVYAQEHGPAIKTNNIERGSNIASADPQTLHENMPLDQDMVVSLLNATPSSTARMMKKHEKPVSKPKRPYGSPRYPGSVSSSESESCLPASQPGSSTATSRRIPANPFTPESPILSPWYSETNLPRYEPFSSNFQSRQSFAKATENPMEPKFGPKPPILLPWYTEPTLAPQDRVSASKSQPHSWDAEVRTGHEKPAFTLKQPVLLPWYTKSTPDPDSLHKFTDSGPVSSHTNATNKDAKPAVGADQPGLLSLPPEAIPVLDKIPIAVKSPPEGAPSSDVAAAPLEDLPAVIVDEWPTFKSRKKPKHSGKKKKKPESTKLSEQNVSQFNHEERTKRRTERRSFEDDSFTPASFIEAAWRTAEAADSLATSVMSETTAKKLRGGFKLVWDDKSYSYLEHYCKTGRVAAVRLLLDHGCNCGTALKPRPKPLMNAIEGRSIRHIKCVRALIRAGTNVNVKHRCKTPIHVLLEQSHFEGYQTLLAMLLAAGAELNIPDPTGEFPLTNILKGSAVDVPLEGYQKECLALIFHPEVQSAVDVNVRQPFTLDTPVHQAVRRRTAQAVALLIHKGADLNAKNASGTTPLLMAANQWRVKLSDQQEYMLKYLLDAGKIDLNAKGGTLGQTALHHAAAAGCAVALEMLLESGADKTVRDKNGNTALAMLEAGREAGAPAKDFQVMFDILTQ